MLGSIWDDVKRQYQYGNMVTRIIIVNVLVFVLVNLLKVVLFISYKGSLPAFYGKIIEYLSVSSDWLTTLSRPWVLITATFLHEGFFHVLWNMLMLYWFGRIVGDFIGNQRVLPIYLLGGVVGSVVYILSAFLLPVGFIAYGASAGVMAIVVGAGVLAPDFEMRLLFIGNVKLKYIVAVLLFLDLISIPLLFNAGGHFAHLGGALFGWLYILMLRNGRDLASPLIILFEVIVRLTDSEKRRRVVHGSRSFKVLKKSDTQKRSKDNGGSARSDKDAEHRINEILDKIKEKGYESLSDEEKDFLFQASKK
jgi:membrane associated rhomboid family serine protease